MDLARNKKIAERLCARRGWSAPEYIANGNSAAVYFVDHPDGPRALKIYDPEFFQGDNALIEVTRVRLQMGLADKDHPHLVKTIEADEIEEDSTWYLLMEYCPWPTLERVVRDVPDGAVHPLLKQLVEAVLFLQGLGLVHRDIKPANIAVSPDFSQLKLLDLGVLRQIDRQEGNGTDDAEKRRFIATAQYSPPEYLTREETPGETGFLALNVYQVGAVLHDLINKTPLFDEEAQTKNKYILYKGIVGRRPRIANPNLPSRLLTLCAMSLEKDQHRRIDGVALEDFLSDADDAGVLRKRIAARQWKAPMASGNPSLHLWRERVRNWTAAAARRERDTLGAFTMPAASFSGGVRWTVEFKPLGAAVHVQLVTLGQRLLVQVVSATTPPVTSTIVEIAADGPDMEAEEIVSALASQILFAIDLAVHFEPSDGASPE